MELINSLCLTAGPHGDGVVTTQAIREGAALLHIQGALCAAPDRHTIQVADRVHISGDSRLWAFLNHSCAPNCRLDFSTWTLVAAREIHADEELTFNYLTTEWDLAEPFVCACGSSGCCGVVRGFRHLARREQERLRPWLSPFLAERLGGPMARASAGRMQETLVLDAPAS